MTAEKGTRTDCLHDLACQLQRYTDANAATSPYPTAIDGFVILRSDRPKPPGYRLFRPALCISVQGAKWAVFGERRYEYRAGQAIVITVEMPSRGAVSEASPSEPFLGFVIELNVALLHELAEQVPSRRGNRTNTALEAPAGVCVIDLREEAIDCLRRAMRLFDTPEAIPVLYPGIERELCYWLLAGPGGEQILRTATVGNHEDRIAAAIRELKRRFAEPVRVDELAALAGMSIATFHRQFRATTAMSPLQYQKQLRLLEARKLMLANGCNVEIAATQVGYESASQFSREYARWFGRPPRRDIRALIESLDAGSA
jgi:AraC-like DNA-binding protein